MALDVYAVCPCGSGKKLKFCCHGLEGSIEQVVRHQSAKQYGMALQLLGSLEQKHPQSAWVKNLQAFTLMMDKRGPEAIGPLTKVLQMQPDNLYSIALFGLASFLESGWKNGKMAIQRAFQRCSTEYPHIIYFLARSIAEFMSSVGSPLGHRQYLGHLYQCLERTINCPQRNTRHDLADSLKDMSRVWMFGAVLHRLEYRLTLAGKSDNSHNLTRVYTNFFPRHLTCLG